MELVVALARIYGAEHLVPVQSVQVAGVSYRNLGPAGLQFLREWGDQGARVSVPTTLNPAGVDLSGWRQMGFEADFAEKQQAVISAYRRLGIRTTCTCTPYLVGNRPQIGDHVAWAESSAVSYANSVLGARTNREGGPSALAAAIVGRTGAYGLHLDESRRATLHVDVGCRLESLSDFGALGYSVGREARNRVPYFTGLAPSLFPGALRALGAAMAASGAVALYHVADVTPEASHCGILSEDHDTLVIDDLSSAYRALDAEETHVDLVWFGCPHASLEEIADLVDLLKGRRVVTALWITTARETRQRARERGLVAAIEASGGRVVADMCVVIAPMQQLSFRTVATPSAKGATYLPSHAGLTVRFGTPADCVEAAVSGVWHQ